MMELSLKAYKKQGYNYKRLPLIST